MWRARVPAVTVLAVLALSQSARAEQGNGLYEPFPSVAAGEQADSYFSQLGLQIGPRELRRGAFDTGLAPVAASAAPSRRAGVDVGGSGAGLLAGGLAVALAAGAAGARTARGRAS
jgi:hypothetical protein